MSGSNASNPLTVSSTGEMPSTQPTPTPGATLQVSLPPPYERPPRTGGPTLLHNINNPLDMAPDLQGYNPAGVLEDPMLYPPTNHADPREGLVTEETRNDTSQVLQRLRCHDLSRMAEAMMGFSLYYWSAVFRFEDEATLYIPGNQAALAPQVVAAILDVGIHHAGETSVYATALDPPSWGQLV
ncbi:hypothetical protein B0F90DRAFT_1818856 [Multifurca ochricompacta]|uniref:Uncharacterized protein n=1 Tax=Multifurca ochricompacta TaxID=376703 RepID=A0AAD4M2S3_9AGAM|nr:hypothetical protein B0F90DRAFT_1818856 [Multifurca ochricompacta]